MTGEALKLTTYFGERDRAGGAFLADALATVYAVHRLRTSLVMRGVEGFGVKHHLRTDRLLTLSEDLPMVSVAVDERARVEAALGDVVALAGDGLITLERARMPDAASAVSLRSDDATKLTVYVGRGVRAGGRPAHIAVVEALHRHGVAGATVLLGVDGTVGGVRRRARFFAANAQVPLMVIAIGAAERIAAALPDVRSLLAEPLLTLERVRVCKRDGRRLAEPKAVAATDPSGLAVWQKLMVYCGEQSRHAGRPLYSELVLALRAAGAAGATALRGVWGYHGDHDPHGDTLWQLRRRVPIVTVIVDMPERIGRWFAIVDELTDETGLVTSEQVPALRATGPGVARGGLRLADPGVR
jgi:PII-like signaling protein